MQLKKLVIVFISISLCLSSQATFIPLTVQEIDGSPSVTKVKNITFNGATLTDLLNGRVLVTVSSAATAAGSTGAIQFNNSNALGADSTNLFWDDTNNRLGIGMNSLNYPLSINGTGLFIKHPTLNANLRIGHSNNNQFFFENSGIGTFMIAGPMNVVDFASQQISALDRGAIISANFGGNSLVTQNGNVLLNTDTGSTTIGTNTAINSQLAVLSRNGNTITQINRGTTGQTANLQEWQNGGGLVLASISNNGTSSFNSIKSNKSLTIAASSANPLEIVAGYPGNYDEQIHFIFNGSTKMFINSTGITSVGDIYTWQNKLIRPFSHGNSYIGFTNGGTFSQDTISLNGWQRVQIGTNSSPVINITASANVGIGTSNPARKLHITDAMRLEPQASPPGTPSLGDIYVDSSEAVCVYVDGAWSKIAGSGTCL